MSRFKKLPRFGWFVTGVVVAALLIPTAAGAGGVLKFVGIEGTSANKVDVTPAGQLQSTEIAPSRYLSSTVGPFSVVVSGSGTIGTVFAPPAGMGAILQSVHVDVSNISGSGNQVNLYLAQQGPGPNCSNNNALVVDDDTVTGDGLSQYSYSPGIAIPAGDVLCDAAGGAVGSSAGSSMTFTVSAYGYSVPSGDVPTAS